MGTILASAIEDQIKEVMSDVDNVTYTTADILEWINDAQRLIALVRPDAASQTASMQLVEGTKQTLSTGRRLIGVVRNMGVDGLTPGRAVGLSEMSALDEANPDWHTDTTSVTVQNYMFDLNRPEEFYVYPPIPASPDVYVEVKEALNPTDVAAIGNTINVEDIYAPVIIEWVMYRLFSRDSEETPNFQRGESHKQNVFNILGIKFEKDVMARPKQRNQQ